jgi:ABC-2 type transport system ATP-binding protein
VLRRRRGRGDLRMPVIATTAGRRAESVLEELVSGEAAVGTPEREPSMDAISLTSLSKTYDDGTEAVRGISLTVGPGEAYGLLGPNGAGKSTTLGMIGTLVRPSAGTALVAGLDVVAERRAARRVMGFAMQQAGVDEFATPLELVVLQGRLQGLPKQEARRRARLLLRLIDLDEAADKRLATFSGGMQRRVDLISALVHLPQVVLLDEPTEGLDPRSRAAIWDTLDELRRRLGMTLVLTTHYMEEADRLCDRVGIVDRGALVVEGTPEELKASVAREAAIARPTLEDVYLHYTGRVFDDAADSDTTALRRAA